MEFFRVEDTFVLDEPVKFGSVDVVVGAGEVDEGEYAVLSALLMLVYG